jgi:hypothetical protein
MDFLAQNGPSIYLIDATSFMEKWIESRQAQEIFDAFRFLSRKKLATILIFYEAWKKWSHMCNHRDKAVKRTQQSKTLTMTSICSEMALSKAQTHFWTRNAQFFRKNSPIGTLKWPPFGTLFVKCSKPNTFLGISIKAKISSMTKINFGNMFQKDKHFTKIAPRTFSGHLCNRCPMLHTSPPQHTKIKTIYQPQPKNTPTILPLPLSNSQPAWQMIGTNLTKPPLPEDGNVNITSTSTANIDKVSAEHFRHQDKKNFYATSAT